MLPMLAAMLCRVTTHASRWLWRVSSSTSTAKGTKVMMRDVVGNQHRRENGSITSVMVSRRMLFLPVSSRWDSTRKLPSACMPATAAIRQNSNSSHPQVDVAQIVRGRRHREHRRHRADSRDDKDRLPFKKTALFSPLTPLPPKISYNSIAYQAQEKQESGEKKSVPDGRFFLLIPVLCPGSHLAKAASPLLSGFGQMPQSGR